VRETAIKEGMEIVKCTSVADPGCFIPDPFIFSSRILGVKKQLIPDPTVLKKRDEK
jgi:hypothetical protein